MKDNASKVPVSVLVPILNEESNLKRCLDALIWASEIFVVDSGSTDKSGDIALEHGATVVQFNYLPPWPKKKNWALENLPFKNEWVLIVDADEELPPEAGQEIAEAIANAGETSAYWINRRFMFMGRWLRHSYYPNWNLRLFKHKLGRYERLTQGDTSSGDNEVHEHIIIEGKTGRLKSEMNHYAFPSVSTFVEKHNRYSNWEAVLAVEGGLQTKQQLNFADVGLKRSLKASFYRLPGRWFLKFLYIFIWQKGFMDGVAGFYFAGLHGFYEFLSEAKTFELKRLNSDAARVGRQP